jgi:hypothetical protein
MASKFEELLKVYPKQFEEFVKDESYFKHYEKLVPKKGTVIVRFFTVREEKKSTLIGIDYRTGEFSEKGMIVPTHFAKVIRSGIDEINPGDITMFPYQEVAGVAANPEMVAYVEALKSTGGATPIKPLDAREVIPRLETSHKRKMVVRPGNMVPDEDDIYTYSFFEGEIQAYYTP